MNSVPAMSRKMANGAILIDYFRSIAHIGLEHFATTSRRPNNKEDAVLVESAVESSELSNNNAPLLMRLARHMHCIFNGGSSTGQSHSLNALVLGEAFRVYGNLALLRPLPPRETSVNV